MYREIEQCRICGNSDLLEVLDLGIQALTGVFPRTRDQPVTAGPLKLVKCTGDGDTCGLLQLQHTYDLGELYGANYGYRSGLNASMVAHLRGKVRDILERARIEPDALIIDVGSNDATTLKAYPSDIGTLVGVDPTGSKFSAFYPPTIQLIPDFFSQVASETHWVIARLPSSLRFRCSTTSSSPQFHEGSEPGAQRRGTWILEQSYMPTMLARNSYDTVCHEHLEYYALRQIEWMATARVSESWTWSSTT
jgi:NDP-4-keto-2,6-dideoxyhexose 3-C-methyltransferase